MDNVDVVRAMLSEQVPLLNLKTAVESPKSAQPLGAPRAAKNGSPPIRWPRNFHQPYAHQGLTRLFGAQLPFPG